jgi:hypothetical protein
MNRTLAVSRMLMANKKTYLWTPLLILGLAWGISLAILWIIDASIPVRGGPILSAAGQSPIWYFAVVGVQSLTLTFPFSQALSVSRRAYFSGTLLTAMAASAGLAVIMLLGGALEVVTNGWGMEGYVFRLPWITDHNWAATFVFIFALTLIAFLVGFTFATIYKRGGITATALSGGGLALFLVGCAALVTWRQAWGSVGAWFAGLTPMTAGLWMLALGALFAAAAAAVLRRTVP